MSLLWESSVNSFIHHNDSFTPDLDLDFHFDSSSGFIADNLFEPPVGVPTTDISNFDFSAVSLPSSLSTPTLSNSTDSLPSSPNGEEAELPPPALPLPVQLSSSAPSGNLKLGVTVPIPIAAPLRVNPARAKKGRRDSSSFNDIRAQTSVENQPRTQSRSHSRSRTDPRRTSATIPSPAIKHIMTEGSSHRGRHLRRGEQLKRNAACVQCRRRRTKCDAAKPHCSACVRHHNYLKKTQPASYGDSKDVGCCYDEDTDGVSSGVAASASMSSESGSGSRAGRNIGSGANTNARASPYPLPMRGKGESSANTSIASATPIRHRPRTSAPSSSTATHANGDSVNLKREKRRWSTSASASTTASTGTPSDSSLGEEVSQERVTRDLAGRAEDLQSEFAYREDTSGSNSTLPSPAVFSRSTHPIQQALPEDNFSYGPSFPDNGLPSSSLNTAVWPFEMSDNFNQYSSFPPPLSASALLGTPIAPGHGHNEAEEAQAQSINDIHPTAALPLLYGPPLSPLTVPHTAMPSLGGSHAQNHHSPSMNFDFRVPQLMSMNEVFTSYHQANSSHSNDNHGDGISQLQEQHSSIASRIPNAQKYLKHDRRLSLPFHNFSPNSQTAMHYTHNYLGGFHAIQHASGSSTPVQPSMQQQVHHRADDSARPSTANGLATTFGNNENSAAASGSLMSLAAINPLGLAFGHAAQQYRAVGAGTGAGPGESSGSSSDLADLSTSAPSFSSMGGGSNVGVQNENDPFFPNSAYLFKQAMDRVRPHSLEEVLRMNQTLYSGDSGAIGSAGAGSGAGAGGSSGTAAGDDGGLAASISAHALGMVLAPAGSGLGAGAVAAVSRNSGEIDDTVGSGLGNGGTNVAVSGDEMGRVGLGPGHILGPVPNAVLEAMSRVDQAVSVNVSVNVNGKVENNGGGGADLEEAGRRISGADVDPRVAEAFFMSQYAASRHSI